ncbi:MAG TPA: PQQ-dependent sugar dehydrogenase [Vicinamibacterales bacterium]|nr:PQQ-dependent sugar dehydrogenase [Vicinamibacterales bacterium]
MRVLSSILTVLAASSMLAAQGPRVIPRPPAQVPNAPPDGSAAPDGYAPIPAWLGQTRAPRPARSEAYSVETVATGLVGGFSFHFLPDGRMVVGERPGRIRVVGKDGKPSPPLGGLPEIWARGPQGLFEVLPDRDFARNRVLYLTYTALPAGTSASNPPRLAGVLTVARARLSDDATRLEDVKTLLNAEGIGGRAIQAADGTLLIGSSIPAGVGINSVDWPQPQQLDSLMGKILRINTDGSVPKDNPFVGRANARPEIFALGIRDDQGMALHPRTGTLWVSEHGPRGGDEINAIEKGKDYGFPAIGYGHEYTGKPIHEDRTAAPGMEQPIYFWTPDIAPAGVAFSSGRLVPGWKDNLFVCALAGKHLVRLVLDRDRVVAEERLLLDLDVRLRDLHEGPDGALYVLTDGNDGKILRLGAKAAR